MRRRGIMGVIIEPGQGVGFVLGCWAPRRVAVVWIFVSFEVPGEEGNLMKRGNGGVLGFMGG